MAGFLGTETSQQGHATEAPSESCRHVWVRAAEPGSACEPGWTRWGGPFPVPPSGVLLDEAFAWVRAVRHSAL